MQHSPASRTEPSRIEKDLFVRCYCHAIRVEERKVNGIVHWRCENYQKSKTTRHIQTHAQFNHFPSAYDHQCRNLNIESLWQHSNCWYCFCVLLNFNFSLFPSVRFHFCFRIALSVSVLFYYFFCDWLLRFVMYTRTNGIYSNHFCCFHSIQSLLCELWVYIFHLFVPSFEIMIAYIAKY